MSLNKLLTFCSNTAREISVMNHSIIVKNSLYFWLALILITIIMSLNKLVLVHIQDHKTERYLGCTHSAEGSICQVIELAVNHPMRVTAMLLEVGFPGVGVGAKEASEGLLPSVCTMMPLEIIAPFEGQRTVRTTITTVCLNLSNLSSSSSILKYGTEKGQALGRYPF